MESTQERVASPGLAMPGKPNLAWLIWGGVVLLAAGLSGVIAIIARRSKKAKEEKKEEPKPQEPQQ